MEKKQKIIIAVSVGAVLLTLGFSLWAIPTWNVWRREMSGKAQLAEAEWNRKIKVQEAEAEYEAAKMLSQAEVERAKGVAEANKIISDGLSGESGSNYLRYLWVQGIREQDNLTVVYVPTEANIPIMEATRKPMPIPDQQEE